MRFAKLTLERYGRFEGCELKFRQGQPDLHVIYGPNEAGKSTSLSGISDLLFGFPARSTYNFLFDYSLLRIGAIIEENGQALLCRRRKSGGNTLVDADDHPISESSLLTMLRGQTRETFRLSFSLDQETLRRGGRAMVEAKNDVGQALFAAGSGLTSVSDELKRLEEEADVIWGRRAKASRTYTRAERELEASLRIMRNESLKPKAWIDAKSAEEATKKHLKEIETRRESLLLESQRAERIRRVAGNVRLRESLLFQIEAAVSTIELSPTIEMATVAAIGAAETAARTRDTSQRLLQELEERFEQQALDLVVLEEANAIEQLVLDLGAATKAGNDLIRLEGERTGAREELQRLRSKAGVEQGITLAAEAVARLRDLARAHTVDVAALEEITTSYGELEDRRKALVATLKSEEERKDLGFLTDTVDAARRLGADVDERCVASSRLLQQAKAELKAALARLRPWAGSADELRSAPPVGLTELERAKELWAEQRKAIADEETTGARLDNEVERLCFQIGAKSTGAAISQHEVADNRHTRDVRWAPLRAYVLDEAPLKDPAKQVASFEEAVVAADDIADRRFALAEASAQLAALETTRAERKLEAEQAHRRYQAASDRLNGLQAEWKDRLQSLGLPHLEPFQLESWLNDRESALQAESELRRHAIDAAALDERRTHAVASLRAALGEPATGDERELAGVLIRAERALGEAEARDEQRRRDRESLAQLERDLTTLERRRAATNARSEPRHEAWERLLVGSRVVLDISTADARLTAFDDVRQAEESLEALERRIAGISRDAKQFHSDVVEVAQRIGLDSTINEEELVKELRSRLEKARSTKSVLDEIEKDRTKRRAEFDEAAAAHAVAMNAITPLLEQTGTSDVAGLSEAIERSHALRETRKALTDTEAAIIRDGDGIPLGQLIEMVLATNTDELVARTEVIARELKELNAQVSSAASAQGEASRAFADLDNGSEATVDAAFYAEQARAEMTAQAEAYILKRAQGLTLRWAIERYREQHQDPLLLRASELFSTLTLGRYSSLRIELGEATPRLLGITDDGRAAVEAGSMSEGTTDQLFLALRLAAVEQSVHAGICLPFLADDLFVNFDDNRAEAGFRVLAELATRTQVLFFTHHSHLAKIARSVLGETCYSECRLS